MVFHRVCARPDPDLSIDAFGRRSRQSFRLFLGAFVCFLCPPAVLRSQSSGRTVVIAAVEGHVAGLFGLVDTLRPEAKGVVSELTRMGLEVRVCYMSADLRILSFGLLLLVGKLPACVVGFYRHPWRELKPNIVAFLWRAIGYCMQTLASWSSPVFLFFRLNYTLEHCDATAGVDGDGR